MEKIIKIFKEKGIEVTNIERANNSFSSNVYIISSTKGKYVFKILFNEEKQKNESSYIKYLSNKINIPKLIFTGSYEDKFYNVVSFIEGINYDDKDFKKLTDEQIYKLGVLLGKLHSIKSLDQDTSSWIEYIHRSADKSLNNLNSIFDQNEEVYKYINNEIHKIEGTYENVILHLDYRIGNVIFNDSEYLIDFESMKSGDSAFDFLKIYRLLNKKRFEIFVEGYKSVRNIDNNTLNKIEFYNIFDAYTALNWCRDHDKIGSKFYYKNMKILQNKFKK